MAVISPDPIWCSHGEAGVITTPGLIQFMTVFHATCLSSAALKLSSIFCCRGLCAPAASVHHPVRSPWVGSLPACGRRTFTAASDKRGGHLARGLGTFVNYSADFWSIISYGYFHRALAWYRLAVIENMMYDLNCIRWLGIAVLCNFQLCKLLEIKVHADIRGCSSWRGRQTRVGLSTTAFFGDLSGYFFGNFRDKASSIILRYAAPCRPVIDCNINDLEWHWVAISCQNPFSVSTSWLRETTGVVIVTGLNGRRLSCIL